MGSCKVPYLKPLYAPFWFVGHAVTLEFLRNMPTTDLENIDISMGYQGDGVGEVVRAPRGDLGTVGHVTALQLLKQKCCGSY